MNGILSFNEMVPLK